MDLTAFKEFGLIGLIVGAILFIAFFIIKWALKFAERIQDRADKQMDRMLSIIEGFQKSQEANTQAINANTQTMILHTEQAKIFHASVIEDLKCMCVDHKKVLERVN